MHRAICSRRAEKAFLDLPDNDARRVKEAIEHLEREPRGQHTIKLEHAPVAQYRSRVGNFRILFDLDDTNQILQILDIRKQDEQTYR
jgi:mRNA interferase RelE/StbE